MDFKKASALDRKRNKDEKDNYTRSKVFQRIMSAKDYEDFLDGLSSKRTCYNY